MKVPSRVDYAAGMKAGLVAGLASIAFYLPAYLVSLYLRNLAGDPLFWRLLFFLMVSDIPVSLVLGLIIGVVFAATQDRFLKGIVLELKGMMYGIAYWLLVLFPYVLLQPAVRQLFFSSADFPISITGNLILGLVLGNFFRRFSYRPQNIVP